MTTSLPEAWSVDERLPAWRTFFRNIFDLIQACGSSAELKPVLFLLLGFLMAQLQGCNIMYQPRFDREAGFEEPSEPLEAEQIVRRRREMTQLLTAPSLRLSRTTSITYDQVMRVLEHSEVLFSETSESSFQEYLDLCRRARDELGMLAPDRIPVQTLREVLANHEDPDRHRERPVVLVFLAREDYINLGFQALNVQSYQIEQLLDHYKVLLYETGSMTEVLYQIHQLMDRGMLPEEKLHGVVFGAHGNSQENQAGLDFKNLHSLSVLSDALAPEALLILSNCNSGKDGVENDSLVNRLTLFREQVWKKPVRVVGCDGYLVDVDFRLGRQGEVEADSVQLRSIGDRLSFGLADSTYVGNPEAVMAARLRELHFPNLSTEYLTKMVRYGISDPLSIRLLFEAEISPEAFWEYSTRLARLGISLEPPRMIECLKEKLTPEIVALYIESIGGLRHLRELKSVQEIKAYCIRYQQNMMEQQMALQRGFPLHASR